MQRHSARKSFTKDRGLSFGVTQRNTVIDKLPGKHSDIPTPKECGLPEVNWKTMGIVIGPPKIPKDISDRLVKAFEVAAKDPEYKKFLEGRYASPFYLAPDKIGSACDEMKEVFRKTMEKAGLLKGK